MHNWMTGKRDLLFANLRLLFELLQVTGLLIGIGSFEPQWLVVRTCFYTSSDVTSLENCPCLALFKFFPTRAFTVIMIDSDVG